MLEVLLFFVVSLAISTYNMNYYRIFLEYLLSFAVAREMFT